jgi:hypothetical protein
LSVKGSRAQGFIAILMVVTDYKIFEISVLVGLGIRPFYRVRPRDLRIRDPALQIKE